MKNETQVKSSIQIAIICLAYLYLACLSTSAKQVIPLTFKSTYDGSEQKGLVQIPTVYDSKNLTPLLVWVQGMYRASNFGIENIL